MKGFKKYLLAILLAFAVATPASADFRFGLKAGAAISDLKFDNSVFSKDNIGGFTGGVMAEFTIPVVNLGVDASILYARRSTDVLVSGNETTPVQYKTDNRDYIDIPINLKWKIGLPVVGKIITPFITTGPDFSFLCSKKNFENAWENRSFDVAWNVGAGVQLFNKVQVAASYGFGLTNSVSGDMALAGTNITDDIKGKNRFWTITLAYLF